MSDDGDGGWVGAIGEGNWHVKRTCVCVYVGGRVGMRTLRMGLFFLCFGFGFGFGSKGGGRGAQGG